MAGCYLRLGTSWVHRVAAEGEDLRSEPFGQAREVLRVGTGTGLHLEAELAVSVAHNSLPKVVLPGPPSVVGASRRGEGTALLGEGQRTDGVGGCGVSGLCRPSNGIEGVADGSDGEAVAALGKGRQGGPAGGRGSQVIAENSGDDGGNGVFTAGDEQLTTDNRGAGPADRFGQGRQAGPLVGGRLVALHRVGVVACGG